MLPKDRCSSVRFLESTEVRAGAPCRVRVQPRTASEREYLSMFLDKWRSRSGPWQTTTPREGTTSSHPQKQLFLVMLQHPHFCLPPLCPQHNRGAEGGSKPQALETELDCMGSPASPPHTQRATQRVMCWGPPPTGVKPFFMIPFPHQRW